MRTHCHGRKRDYNIITQQHPINTHPTCLLSLATFISTHIDEFRGFMLYSLRYQRHM